MEEYEVISDLSLSRMSGVRDHQFDVTAYENVYTSHVHGRKLLVLDTIENFHRRYRWS